MLIRLFILFAVFVLVMGLGGLSVVLRGLRGILSLLHGSGKRVNAPRGPRREVAVERMRACAYCDVHIPESEGVRVDGEFFCCEAHARAGAARKGERE
ncbi:MAG: hypothetical protein LBB76_09825 [Azoarcus sp.]|nr:hypothetical protein [Azoarcus sp.]